MDNINSVFAKWLLIAASTEREMNAGRWNAATIGSLQQQITENKNRLDLDAVYQNVNAYYNIDLKIMLKQTSAYKELHNDIKQLKDNSNRKFFFLTVGFDDKVITVPKIKEAVSRLHDIKGVEVSEYVVEKHRRDVDTKQIYIHHHLHAIVYTDFPKSKTVDYIFQKFSGKKFQVVAGKNFIDLKREQPIENYIKYIRGDKTEEKLECIKKDKEWRELNNL